MKPTSLVHGAKLEVEDLDLQGIGMYTQTQKETLLAQGVPADDFFPGDGLANGYWMRKSDRGVKWDEFRDSDLKLHKALTKGK